MIAEPELRLELDDGGSASLPLYQSCDIGQYQDCLAICDLEGWTGAHLHSCTSHCICFLVLLLVGVYVVWVAEMRIRKAATWGFVKGGGVDPTQDGGTRHLLRVKGALGPALASPPHLSGHNDPLAFAFAFLLSQPC